MLQNYFKIAFRNITKRRAYSLLNVAGLAIGMICCLLLLQYVNYEFSYDGFHKKADHIYRLQLNSYQDGKLAWESATSYPAIVPTMIKDFPEVVNGCRLIDAEGVFVNTQNNTFFEEKKGYFADPAFLQMFDLQLTKGDPATALNDVDAMIVSETFAQKYFGAEDPIDKTLVLRNFAGDRPIKISGIFKDYPANSHLIVDYLISWNTFKSLVAQADPENPDALETSWGWYDFYSFIEVKPGTNLQALQAKFPAMWEQYNKDWIIPGTRWNELELQPLKEIYLYSNINQEAEVNGNGKAVSFLLLIAFAILGIAWVNYINLATARAIERSQEVGVRKTLGAMRGQLIGQFLMESFLLNGAAFVLALGAVVSLMPALQQFTGKEIGMDLFQQPSFWLGTVAVFLLGTLIAGLYPAFVLSSFKPITAMRNEKASAGGGQLLRKGLVVAQFVASIVLIVGTIIISQQLDYMRNQDLGANIEQTLVVEGPSGNIPDSIYQGQFNHLKEEWLHVPGVKSVTASTSVAGDEIYWTGPIRWKNKGEEISLTHYHLGIDYDFLEAYEMKMAAGRNFSKEFGSDDRTAILNETSVKQLGIESPEAAIGQRVVRGRSDTLEIIGVVKDFHHQGLQKAHNPILILLRPTAASFYSLKVQSPNIRNVTAQIEQTWRSTFPQTPFDYFFLDEFFNKQYQSDIQFSRVFSSFSMLAILIACLGLLGLASYSVLQRTKEIGIRKILGASGLNIVRLISRDFLKLVAVAIVLAVPVAWYLMNNWLDTFAYRIDIQWWVFVLAGVAALAIALLTVASQALRAAATNPVESLRTE
ncbi:MAG: ABC transporter permease [Saprospiraceae bacterium]|nr:ABC transporter permease [Saprospiraceae bacterium]